MSDTFETRTNDLMREVYDTLHDTTKVDAIMALTFDAPADDDATSEGKVTYHITVPSKSKGSRTYDATHVSSDTVRNAKLLNLAITDYLTTSDVALRASIREMIDALLDVL